MMNGMFPSLMHTFIVASEVRDPKEWASRGTERHDENGVGDVHAWHQVD